MSSRREQNHDQALDNLDEPGASKSSTSGITGGSTGGAGKGKDNSSPIGTYDTSSSHNTSGAQSIDSWSGGIPGTKTSSNKK